jgi:hypothetical protein
VSADESNTGERDRRARSAFLLALAAYLAFVAHFNFVTDDAYISFRYARHLAQGHGLNFNPGVDGPVEGTSELLWVLLLAPFELLGLDVPLWSRILSIAAGVALLWRVNNFLVRDLGLALPAAAMGLLWVALLPPFTAWSTGGMATAPFALLLFVLYERLCGPREAPNGWTTGWIAVAMLVLRAESLPWLVGLVALSLWFARRNRDRSRAAAAWRALALGLAGAGALVAWRLWYFGYPLPNTAYAKVGGTLAQLERGAYYVLRFFTTLPAVLLVLAAGAWVVWRERSLALVAAAAMVAATFAFTLMVGGDFMGMFRFLAPGVPFLGVLFAAAIARLWTQGPLARNAALLTFALNAAVAIAASFGVEPVRGLARRLAAGGAGGGEHQTQLEDLRWQRFDAELWSDLGRALARHVPRGASLVARGIGAVSYYSDLTIYDRHGLVSAEVTHGDVERKRGAAAGHDMFVGIAFFERHRPSFAYAGLHATEDLEHPNARLFRQIFGSKGDAEMTRVYRPVLVPLPERGSGSYLLLAERDPAPDGGDHGWQGALLETAVIRPER